MKLTVRRGPKVSRQSFDHVEQAIEAMRAEAESVRAEGPLDEVTMLRTYEPSSRVAARLEIATGGRRGKTAGIDVMGDGRLVSYRGGIIRRELEVPSGATAFDAVREALR